MKMRTGEVCQNSGSGPIMKIHGETEELTVRILGGLLRIDAKGPSAIRAVRNPIGLIFISIAVAILVLSMSHANTELVIIPFQ
jgi:hypothetical protein